MRRTPESRSQLQWLHLFSTFDILFRIPPANHRWVIHDRSLLFIESISIEVNVPTERRLTISSKTVTTRESNRIAYDVFPQEMMITLNGADALVCVSKYAAHRRRKEVKKENRLNDLAHQQCNHPLPFVEFRLDCRPIVFGRSLSRPEYS